MSSKTRTPNPQRSPNSPVDLEKASPPVTESADEGRVTAVELEAGLDESDPFWHAYVEEAKTFDESFIGAWNQDLDSLLLFAGLFSAVLTAFIIESRKGLQEDLQAETNVILRQILDRLAPGQEQAASSIPAEEKITWVVMFVNGMWFASLTASLASAMGAILGKEWVREYSKNMSQCGVYRIDARRRQSRYDGIISWHLSTALSTIPALLHIAALLFVIGLVAFLWADSTIIAWTFLAPICLVIILYVVATILPLIHDCPYRTPFTTIIMKLLPVIRKLLPGFLRQFVQHNTHYRTPTARDDVDASALAWCLTTASNPGRVVTAVKSVARLKGTPTQTLRIINQGGDVIASRIRSCFIQEPERVHIAPAVQSEDLASFMHTIERLYCKPLEGIDLLGGRPFVEFRDILKLVLREEDAGFGQTLGQPGTFSLKCNIILAYASIALQSHGHSQKPDDSSLIDPISKLLDVWVNIRYDKAQDPMKLRVIRALASLSAVLGPIRGDGAVGSFGAEFELFTSKIRTFSAFLEVLQASPFPPLELLQAALLGMEGLYRRLPDWNLPLDSTPDDILNMLFKLLAYFQSPVSPSPPSSPSSAHLPGHTVLLSLIGRLGQKTFLLKCSTKPFQSLSTALRSCSESQDDVIHCYARVALSSLKSSTDIHSTKRSNAIISRMIQDDHIPDDQFATMFQVISSQLNTLNKEHQILIGRCCKILSTASTMVTSQGCIIRGLYALEFQESTETGDFGILKAVVEFLMVAVDQDHIPEDMDLALDLVRIIIDTFPKTSLSLFANSKGFDMLQTIISFKFPLPQAISTALMDTVYSVLTSVLSSSSEQLQELETELNKTDIFSKIRLRPTLFDQVKDASDWLTIMTDLTEKIPPRLLPDRKALLAGILQAYDSTSKGPQYRFQIDRLRSLDAALVDDNVKPSTRWIRE